jgi:hypothetical protein
MSGKADAAYARVIAKKYAVHGENIGVDWHYHEILQIRESKALNFTQDVRHGLTGTSRGQARRTRGSGCHCLGFLSAASATVRQR